VLKSGRFQAMVKENALSLPIPYLVWLIEEKYQMLYFSGTNLHPAAVLVKSFFDNFLNH
jgi:hypothetical protein